MDTSERRLLEQRLTERLFLLYERVGRETGYWANYFLRDLKRLGGLEVARKLLDARSVSEGFERLRKEHLLRESVEAVILEPQFQPLFSPSQLTIARQRLSDNGYTPDELSPDIAEPSGDLALVLERVETAPEQSDRWDLRDDVVGHGAGARDAMRLWLAEEKLVPFALSVLERLSPEDPTVPRIIDAYLAAGGRERKLASAALDRIRATRRAPRPPSSSEVPGG